MDSDINWVIIDGNNLIHRDERLKRTAASDFDRARRELVAMLDRCAGDLADQITVVFDGKVGGQGAAFMTSSVDVQFAPGHLSADSVIEILVNSSPTPAGMMVVTNDRAERHTVESAGGQTMSCISFIEELESAERRINSRAHTGRRKASGGTIGDFFPDDES